MAETSDEEIREQATERLLNDPRTRDVTVEVEPVAGNVSLRGVVGSEAVKQAAAEIVRSVPGVTLVINELMIRPGRTEEQPEPPAIPPTRSG